MVEVNYPRKRVIVEQELSRMAINKDELAVKCLWEIILSQDTSHQRQVFLKSCFRRWPWVIDGGQFLRVGEALREPFYATEPPNPRRTLRQVFHEAMEVRQRLHCG